MGRITAFESVTLDGVMQAPGRPDEDTRGGFPHGGWAAGFHDERAMAFAGASMSQTRALLLGRRTYEDLLGFWSAAPRPNPFTDVLLGQQKYVVSRDGRTRLGYPCSTLLAGEAVETVARLREEAAGVVTVLGSGELVRSLLAAGLVDELLLQVHPVVLGTGARLFGATERRALTLAEAESTSTGVLLARYLAPAGAAPGL